MRCRTEASANEKTLGILYSPFVSRAPKPVTNRLQITSVFDVFESLNRFPTERASTFGYDLGDRPILRQCTDDLIGQRRCKVNTQQEDGRVLAAVPELPGSDGLWRRR